jgi:hypothetical protein
LVVKTISVPKFQQVGGLPADSVDDKDKVAGSGNYYFLLSNIDTAGSDFKLTPATELASIEQMTDASENYKPNSSIAVFVSPGADAGAVISDAIAHFHGWDKGLFKDHPDAVKQYIAVISAGFKSQSHKSAETVTLNFLAQSQLSDGAGIIEPGWAPNKKDNLVYCNHGVMPESQCPKPQ